MDETLSEAAVTAMIKFLLQKVESLEERMTTHGHNVLGDTTGTPVQWVPPSKQQSLLPSRWMPK
jgi:hypothetical protein